MPKINQLTPGLWRCLCETDFIHEASEEECVHCKTPRGYFPEPSHDVGQEYLRQKEMKEQRLRDFQKMQRLGPWACRCDTDPIQINKLQNEYFEEPKIQDLSKPSEEAEHAYLKINAVTEPSKEAFEQTQSNIIALLKQRLDYARSQVEAYREVLSDLAAIDDEQCNIETVSDIALTALDKFNQVEEIK